MLNRMKDDSARQLSDQRSRLKLITLETSPGKVCELILKRFGVHVTEDQVLEVKEEQYLERLIEEQKRNQYERLHSGISGSVFEV